MCKLHSSSAIMTDDGVEYESDSAACEVRDSSSLPAVSAAAAAVEEVVGDGPDWYVSVLSTDVLRNNSTQHRAASLF